MTRNERRSRCPPSTFQQNCTAREPLITLIPPKPSLNRPLSFYQHDLYKPRSILPSPTLLKLWLAHGSSRMEQAAKPKVAPSGSSHLEPSSFGWSLFGFYGIARVMVCRAGGHKQHSKGCVKLFSRYIQRHEEKFVVKCEAGLGGSQHARPRASRLISETSSSKIGRAEPSQTVPRGSIDLEPSPFGLSLSSRGESLNPPSHSLGFPNQAGQCSHLHINMQH